MNVVLYSAVYGGYDYPKPLPPGVTGVLYTDTAVETPGWEVRVEPVELAPTPMLKAKFWKTHPFAANPEADIAVWVDGSMTLRRPDFVNACVQALGSDDLALMRHPERNCILAEADFAARLPRYYEENLVSHANDYLAQGHPLNWGLFALGNFAVRRTSATIQLFNDWWLACTERTYMDQVPFPPLLRHSTVPWNTNIPWWSWWDYTDHNS